MGKFLKKFETHSAYNTYINGQDKILPNVSYCKDNNEVHYNPWVETRLVAKFNVEDNSEPTQIYAYSSGTATAEIMFEKIEIDNVDVSVSSLDTAEGRYQFNTTGEHTIKYTLVNPTLIGINQNTMTIGATFYGCNSLTNVRIPNSVTSISDGAFQECSSLTNITIPNGVTSIGDFAFYNCSSLTNITMPNGVTSIGENAFANCSGLTNITIPNGVTTIGNYAFNYCTGLTSVVIGNSVTSIGDYIFYGCINLTSLTMGNGVTEIGYFAFYLCTSLTSITIPSGIMSIDSQAFGMCYFTSNNFINNSSLDEVTNNYWGGMIVDSDTNGLCLKNNELIACRGNVTNAIIPNTVTSIGTYAFISAINITSVTISSSITSIGNGAFAGCTKLASITVDVNNTTFDSRNNCNAIIKKSNNELIVGCKNTVIPNSVTSIGNGAFEGCRELGTITIPNTITSIGNGAFYQCNNLEIITCLSTTAPTIGNTSFRNVKTNGTLYVPAGSTGYDVWMGAGNYYLGKYNWTKVEQ